MTNEPRLPDIGVLALVPDQWSMQWDPRHHVLTRLAKYFYVAWVNPAHEWREMLAIWKAHTTQQTEMVQPPGFTVYTPEFWLPKLYRPGWAARLSFHQRLKHARGLLTSKGCKKIILYLWRPTFARALGTIPFDLSCYHIDDEYTFSVVDVPVEKSEAQLIAGVDHTFIHSPALLEKKGKINPNTSFIPNGVDYEAYAKAAPEPPDLQAIPQPRIGYSGFLKKQLDWSLLIHLAKQHRRWHFVFVGAQNPNLAEVTEATKKLSSLQNVYFLGAKSVQELAAYARHFSVCIMPYLADDYTKYIYPMKLHEYLASGRPVVGTKIRTLVNFANIVSLASTADEWSAAIAEALSPAANSFERRAARQTMARQHDWNLLVAKIARTMAQRLGQEYADRLAQSGETRKVLAAGLGRVE